MKTNLKDIITTIASMNKRATNLLAEGFDAGQSKKIAIEEAKRKSPKLFYQ